MREREREMTVANSALVMGSHRSALCLHLDGRVTDLDTPVTFGFPQYSTPLSLSPTRAHMGLLSKKVDGIFSSITFEVDCSVYDLICFFRFQTTMADLTRAEFVDARICAQQSDFRTAQRFEGGEVWMVLFLRVPHEKFTSIT